MVSFHYKYQSLLQSLEHCQQQPFSQVQVIEISFQICFTCYRDLEEEIHNLDVKGRELILLNKAIRSFFLARIEYYVLLYHAVLFCPLEKGAAIRFWTRESVRLEKFRKEHAAFYGYYKSGSVTHDDMYYSCTAALDDPADCGTVILAKLLALEEYNPYVKEKLLHLNLCKGSKK